VISLVIGTKIDKTKEPHPVEDEVMKLLEIGELRIRIAEIEHLIFQINHKQVLTLILIKIRVGHKLEIVMLSNKIAIVMKIEIKTQINGIQIRTEIVKILAIVLYHHHHLQLLVIKIVRETKKKNET